LRVRTTFREKNGEEKLRKRRERCTIHLTRTAAGLLCIGGLTKVSDWATVSFLIYQRLRSPPLRQLFGEALIS